MTLSSTLTKNQYDGDDSTTAFAVGFVFYNDSDLRVILTVDATGVETVQTLTTDYTLSGGDGATGTLTMVTPPATGETLTIKSNISDIQETSLPIGGEFPSTTVERRLDIITRLIQQQAEEILRSATLTESSALSGLQIPDPESGKFLAGNSTNDGYINQDISLISNTASGVDETDTDTTKDKLISNSLAKTFNDAATIINAGTADKLLNGDGTWDDPDYNLLDLPAGYRNFVTSNNATDSAHDIDIAAGMCRDAGDAANIVLSSTLVKQIDATWAVGTNAGGLDTGAVAANTGYGVWAIRRSDTGVCDVMFSTDKDPDTAPTNLPASYDQYRLIGWVKTDASSNIRSFVHAGNMIRLTDLPHAEVSDSTITNGTFETATLTVPGNSTALIYGIMTNTSETNTSGNLWIKRKGSGETASGAMAWMNVETAGTHDSFTKEGQVMVDGNSQIEYAASEGAGTAQADIRVYGCILN